MADHNDLGKWGEDLAADYLRQKGYSLLTHNWEYGRSKIDLDLVCKSADGRYCVFVEVKTRYSVELTEPEDAVDVKKMRGLGRMAHWYIQTFDIVEEPRFDIVAITGHPTQQSPTIKHIEDAFNPLLL